MWHSYGTTNNREHNILAFFLKKNYTFQRNKYFTVNMEQNNNNISITIIENNVADKRHHEYNVNNCFTSEYKVTIQEGGNEKHYTIIDASVENYINNNDVNDKSLHGLIKCLDGKYIIKRTNNDDKIEKKTFMYHFNRYDNNNKKDINNKIVFSKEEKDDEKKTLISKEIDSITDILQASGYCDLKNKNVTIQYKQNIKTYNTTYQEVVSVKEMAKCEEYKIGEKPSNLYSMDNFLSRTALKFKQIGRWFSDKWDELKMNFTNNSQAKNNLNNTHKTKNDDIQR